MKKIVTLIFCVMLILAMAGCGQSPKAADKDTRTQQAIIDKANKAPEKQEFTPVTEVQEGRKNVYVVLNLFLVMMHIIKLKNLENMFRQLALAQKLN